MNFQDAVTTCFKKYIDVNGRASRSEFWWFFLFCFIGQVIFQVIFAPLAMLFGLATLIPSITVGVRRFHDMNKTGWLVLIGLIPLLGAITLLIWFAMEGTKGSNHYGPEAA